MTDTLTCNYDYTDVDNDPDLSTYTWSINGTEVLGNPFIEVRTSAHEVCALDSLGFIECWGDDSTGVTSESPMSSGHNAVGVYDGFACSLDGTGSIECWGDNGLDQLNAPLRDGFIKLAGSGESAHACAVHQDETIECWGISDGSSGDFGQVTDTPTTANFIDVAVSSNATCAVEKTGAVQCWGNDNDGLVSDAPLDEVYTAVFSGWFHACALNQSGEVICWGRDDSDQVSNAPTDGDYVQLDVGWKHSCALNNQGDGLCWGLLSPKGSRITDDFEGNLDTNLWTVSDPGYVRQLDLNPHTGSGALRISNTSRTATTSTLPVEGCSVVEYSFWAFPVSSLDSNDFLSLEVYNASFNTWTTQTSVYGNTAENTYTQYSGSLDLSFPYDPNDLKFRFFSSSQPTEYFYIDDVTFTGTNCASASYVGQTDLPADMFQSVAAGAYHSCAINLQGGLTCFGLDDGSLNDVGQVRDAPLRSSNLGSQMSSNFMRETSSRAQSPPTTALTRLRR